MYRLIQIWKLYVGRYLFNMCCKNTYTINIYIMVLFTLCGSCILKLIDTRNCALVEISCRGFTFNIYAENHQSIRMLACIK